MNNATILTQFDNAELVGIKIIIALFTAIFLILSLILGLTLTCFLLSFKLARKALVFILSRKETRAAFALLGV